MTEDREVRIAEAELRRILHHYNNLISRVLTRAEVALLEHEPGGAVAALEAIVKSALELGAFTQATREALLPDQGRPPDRP